VAQASLKALSAVVKISVEPEDSNRTTGTMPAFGRLTPELYLANVGSFQLVIEPLKIPTICSRVNMSFVTPGMLYANTIALHQQQIIITDLLVSRLAYSAFIEI